MSITEAYGCAPLWAYNVVWLDSGKFDWENETFAALLIHELRHCDVMLRTKLSDPERYQIESDFLWAEAITGKSSELNKDIPNTSYGWISLQAEQMDKYRVKNPAITR